MESSSANLAGPSDDMAISDSYTLEKEGKYDWAIKRLISLDSKSHSYFYHLRLGWLYTLDKKNKNAETHYREALKINQNGKTAKMGLSHSLYSQGNHKEAIEILEKMLIEWPSDYLVGEKLIHFYATDGDSEKALNVIRSLQKIYPEDVPLMLTALKYYLKQEDSKNIEATAQDILEIHPQNVEALKAMESVSPVSVQQ